MVETFSKECTFPAPKKLEDETIYGRYCGPELVNVATWQTRWQSEFQHLWFDEFGCVKFQLGLKLRYILKYTNKVWQWGSVSSWFLPFFTIIKCICTHFVWSYYVTQLRLMCFVSFLSRWLRQTLHSMVVKFPSFMAQVKSGIIVIRPCHTTCEIVA